MASEFIGYEILVTLQGPPPVPQLRGIVADVVQQQLVLKDVMLLWSGQYLPSYHIDSSVIADLEVVSQQQSLPSSETHDALGAAENVYSAHGQRQGPAVPEPAIEPFIDPAILSFTKPEISAGMVSADSYQSRPQQTDIVSPVMLADNIKQSPVSFSQPENSGPSTRTSQPVPDPALPAVKLRNPRDRRDSTATATLTEPFDHMALNEEDTNVAGRTAKGVPSTRGTVKRNRRGPARKAKENPHQTTPDVVGSKDVEALQASGKKPATKGKGWRQTPLVEEVPPATAEAKKRQPRHQSRKALVEDVNGWATEDATDIQDLGEFDFEHNLSKFDKRRVFDDIRKDDTTADVDRLVSFNRNARPGTNGGRNLHYTENVLDLPEQARNVWKSEAGETEEDEPLEEHYSSGRVFRRDDSHRPTPLRKGTLVPTKAPVSATASPLNGSVSSFRASLRLASNNKPCICVSPLQMLEMEQLCTSELGLSDEILSENAGRGLAEAAINLPPDLSAAATILFLVGNHKTGSRAVAAARHLRNRNLRILVSVLGGERESMLLQSLKWQLDMYRKSGGWTVRWDEFQTKAASSSGGSPDLIFDALLGMHVTFAELRTDDQAIAFEMIRWANRSAVPVLAVDVPSGLQAASGEVTVVDSAPLVMHATFVVCLGAPKSGLLAALGTGEGKSQDWRVSVVDMGISTVAWRKYGTRRRHGVDFGKEWVVELKFVGGLDGV